MTIDPFEIASAGDDSCTDSWLVTYADAITLLMAFFVVMFSISKPDSEKLDQVSGGLSQALHKKGSRGLTVPDARQGSRAADRPG